MSAKSKINWNALSTIVLAATLLAVTYTAIMTKRSVDQMRRSVDLYKYQLLVQDRPHVVFGPFFCKYDKESKFLYVIGQGKCFGETPAYDFKNTGYST